MENAKFVQADVAKRIQECLKEMGFDAEVQLSEHEGIIYARKEIQGQCVRVVTHISDREPKTVNSGGVSHEVSRARLATAVIRPSLAAQAATRYVPASDATKGNCT